MPFRSLVPVPIPTAIQSFSTPPMELCRFLAYPLDREGDVRLEDVPDCKGCERVNQWPQPAHKIEDILTGAQHRCRRCHPLLACVTWAARFIPAEDITYVYTLQSDHFVLQTQNEPYPHFQCALLNGEIILSGQST